MLLWKVFDPSLPWCDGIAIGCFFEFFYFHWLLLLSFVPANEYIADEFEPIFDTYDNEYFEKIDLPYSSFVQVGSVKKC